MFRIKRICQLFFGCIVVKTFSYISRLSRQGIKKVLRKFIYNLRIKKFLSMSKYYYFERTKSILCVHLSTLGINSIKRRELIQTILYIETSNGVICFSKNKEKNNRHKEQLVHSLYNKAT